MRAQTTHHTYTAKTRGDPDPRDGSATNRRGLLAASTAAVGLLAAACGPLAGAGRSGTGGTAGQPVTLKVLYSSNSPADHDVFVKVFQAFGARKPAVTLDTDDAPGTDVAAQKATTLIVSGTPPDVMWLHPSWVLDFIRSKRLRDLTDLARADKAAYIPVQLDFWSDQGRLYGLPYNSNPSILWYNRSLFRRHGVKTPEEHVQAGTWTWQTLREVARQVTVGSGAEGTFGYDAGVGGLQFYTCVPIWCNRGELTNRDETAWLLDTEPVVEVIQWHADMHLKEKSLPLPSDRQGVNLFRVGRVGMLWGGKHNVTDILNVIFAEGAFELGHVGTPRGKVGPINRDGPLGFGLPAGAGHVPQAYQLARFIGSPEAAPVYLGTGRGLPVEKALVNSPIFITALKPFERAEVYAETSRTVRAWRVPGKASQENALFQAEWDKVLLGQQSVPQAMAAAKAAMDPLLK